MPYSTSTRLGIWGTCGVDYKVACYMKVPFVDVKVL